MTTELDPAQYAAFLDSLTPHHPRDPQRHRIVASDRPMSYFIDWLDQPDIVIDTAQGTLMWWNPLRLGPGAELHELGVMDFGDRRAVYCSGDLPLPLSGLDGRADATAGSQR